MSTRNHTELWKEFMLISGASEFDIKHVGLISDNFTEELTKISELISEEKALTHGPYKTGIEWLRDAGQPYRTRKESEQSIRAAKERFMDALGNENASLYRKAMIEFPIAACNYLIGDKIGAYDWFIRAKASTIDALNALDHREKNMRPLLKPLYGALFAVGMVGIGPLTIAGFILEKVDPRHSVIKKMDQSLKIIPAPLFIINEKRVILNSRLLLMDHMITTNSYKLY